MLRSRQAVSRRAERNASLLCHLERRARVTLSRRNKSPSKAFEVFCVVISSVSAAVVYAPFPRLTERLL